MPQHSIGAGSPRSLFGLLDRPAYSFGTRLAWAATRIAIGYRASTLTQADFEPLAEPTAIRSPEPEDDRMKRVKHLIRKHLASPLGLEAMADEVGLHPIYVARCFRAAYGVSCGEYLARVRAEYAGRLLAATALPLTDVAIDAGFFDQSHFTNSFRRVTGLTPGAYRACYCV